jgi:chemotaxis signal transduction protein
MTESITTMDPSGKTMAEREGKYLTFSLAREDYGVGILKVKEIIGMLPITSVPQTPDYIKGVINLRGKVIPIIDLRLRFGMQEINYTERTCIIVIETQASRAGKCWKAKNCNKRNCPAYENQDLSCWIISGTFCRDEIQGSFHEKIDACRQCDFYRLANERAAVMTVGVVVDSVSEVLNIRAEDIQDTPTFGTTLNTDYILGMAKKDGGVKILLDIDRVIGGQGVSIIEKAA